jgi:hypothetical protein
MEDWHYKRTRDSLTAIPEVSLYEAHVVAKLISSMEPNRWLTEEERAAIAAVHVKLSQARQARKVNDT